MGRHTTKRPTSRSRYRTAPDAPSHSGGGTQSSLSNVRAQADHLVSMSLDWHIGKTELVITSMPLLPQFLLNDPVSFHRVLPLGGATQCRLIAYVKTAGSGTVGTVAISYRAGGYSGTFGDYAPAGPSLLVNVAGTADTGWVDLVEAAREDDTSLALVTFGGNGAASPALSYLTVLLR